MMEKRFKTFNLVLACFCVIFLDEIMLSKTKHLGKKEEEELKFKLGGLNSFLPTIFPTDKKKLVSTLKLIK